MRTLGVDPGLTRCGLGVVDGPRPGRAASGRGGLSLVAVGVVRTPAGSDPGERLLFLSDEVERWLDVLRSVDDERMQQPCGPAEGPWGDRPFADLVLHINREVIHHLAEVALLRDLWAHRG